jgi:hypothetical protein
MRWQRRRCSTAAAPRSGLRASVKSRRHRTACHRANRAPPSPESIDSRSTSAKALGGSFSVCVRAAIAGHSCVTIESICSPTWRRNVARAVGGRASASRTASAQPRRFDAERGAGAVEGRPHVCAQEADEQREDHRDGIQRNAAHAFEGPIDAAARRQRDHREDQRREQIDRAEHDRRDDDDRLSRDPGEHCDSLGWWARSYSDQRPHPVNESRWDLLVGRSNRPVMAENRRSTSAA